MKIEDVFHAAPLAILADRSRDASSGRALLRLAPGGVFLVTDNRRRLSRKLLSRYDVLAVCGNSTVRYGRRELAAIRGFVRRGGAVVLAACSGSFELLSGRPMGELSANAVAGMFGFEFVSAAGLPPDVSGVLGYDRARLALTPEGKQLGLELGEIPLGRPGPLGVPRGAKVLLREKSTGQAVIATARSGRGRVLACNDLGMWNAYNPWAATRFLLAVSPRRRACVEGRRKRPDDIIETPYSESRAGGLVVSHTQFTHSRAKTVLRLGRRVRDELVRIVRPRKRPKVWRVTIETGCGAWNDWGPREEVWSSVGSCLSDAALAGGLTRCLAERLVFSRHSWNQFMFMDPLIHHLKVLVLERLGFGEHAAALRAACVGGPRVDLGRVYPWADIKPEVRRLWSDVEDELGPDALRRFARAVPRKDSLKGIDRHVFGEFDIFAFFLARALGERAYAWLEARGYTLRRIPLKEPGSKELARAVKRTLENRLTERSENASDRLDAAAALARRLRDEKVSLDRCARRAKSKRLAEALPAAAGLLLARDERGAKALARFLRSRVKGLAADAALLMVCETGERRAADVLARVAGKQDVRFQLAAGNALKIAGDRRASRFAFERVRGCELKVVRDGMVKAFPTVEGYEVANVWGEPTFRGAPYDAAYSDYYVAWVHTSRRWRRRGLGRIGMEVCLSHGLKSGCSVTSLGTGTRNVAHALYRSFGLIDCHVSQDFRKDLRPEGAIRPPKGFRIRRADAKDAPATARLLNDELAGQPHGRIRLERWPGKSAAWVAFEKRRLIGVASARPRGKSAALEYLAVAKVKKKKDGDDAKAREELGHALLSAVHRDLLRQKVKTVSASSWRPMDEEYAFWLLRRCGYGSRPGGGVEMRCINDLVQYLKETVAVFERRLRESEAWAGWSGSILLDGGRLRATLVVERGKVSSKARTKGRPSVTIRGGERPVQRIVMGAASPFEEYLQKNVAVLPALNGSTRDLLEALFPRTASD